MFNKKKTHLKTGATDTLIGEGTVFTGKLSSEAGIRIEGQVIGDIISKGEVTIGEKGAVHSTVSAKDVVIAGSVNGKVVAAKLTITPTGRMIGSIQAEKLVIDQGALFQGTSDMAAARQEAPEKTERGGVALEASQQEPQHQEPAPALV
ncbi:bactofilin family protein [Paenibacillus thalictri]|uniref:bactofilin family protein n=1 Tax=Paenibacillus thalictri TaxID=2527873 RepID=UPI001F0DA8BD|nr:polymer-forming cytoskeletal protein [Paenibacillus thalictri]